MNSPPNDDFRLSLRNFVLLHQKLKKQKWQCSQSLDLNPTYVTAEYCCQQHALATVFSYHCACFERKVTFGLKKLNDKM